MSTESGSGQPGEIERAVVEAKLDREVYFKWIEPLKKAWDSHNLEQPFSNLIGQYDERTFALLLMCDRELQRHTSEGTVFEEDIQNLRTLTESLRESLKSANLPAALVDYCVRHVEMIECALTDYALKGASAFDIALQQSVGLAFTRRATHKEVTESAIRIEFLKLLAAYVLVTTAAVNTDDLVRRWAGRLLMGGNGQPQLLEIASSNPPSE